MNKIEVGMYVRTKIGIISKCTNILEDCSYDFDRIIYQDNYNEDGFMEMPYLLINKYIIKSSHNIIDLIEVGDIITYEYPTALGIITHENVTVLQELLDILKNGENNHEYKIKSIVTKEQFESVKYEVSNE